MALTRKGNQNLLFGAAGVSANGIVIVTGYSVRNEFSLNVEGRGSLGEVEAWVLGSKKYSITIEGYCQTSTPPAIGGDVTVGTLTGTITSAQVDATNEDFAKCRVEATGYEDVT